MFCLRYLLHRDVLLEHSGELCRATCLFSVQGASEVVFVALGTALGGGLDSNNFRVFASALFIYISSGFAQGHWRTTGWQTLAASDFHLLGVNRLCFSLFDLCLTI